MKVKVVECSKCGDKIYSRTRRDYNSCTCGNVSVDGGHFDGVRWNFERIIGDIESKQEYMFIDLSEAQMMDDYHMKWNKLGRIIPKVRPLIKKKKIIKQKKEKHTLMSDEQVKDIPKEQYESFKSLQPEEP